ncbi:cytochrome P450 CYP736A12-like [Apium graveolens]|uniref:cytochrome P450 CYP736A12-like n=1 Tax=Apium graveolens TaxID=4045 RepID=UPI003D78DA48
MWRKPFKLMLNLNTNLNTKTYKMSPTDFTVLLVLVGVVCSSIHFVRTIFTNTPLRRRKLPPGPPGLPLVGHLHMLGKFPPRTLYKLSQKYGHIMSLRLGSVPTIIISSPSAAELFLKTHDTVFASRPKSQAAYYLSNGTKAMGFSDQYGPYWRSVRKFCTLEFLSATKIDSMAGLRREELRLVVESLKKAAEARAIVNLSETVSRLIEDMTCRMLFGKSRDDRFNLSKVLHELAEIMGTFSIADFIPILGPLDLQGLSRRLKVTSRAADKILETIIDDHEMDASNDSEKLNRDFLDAILSLRNNPTSTHEPLAQNINRSNIKAILLDMLFAAIDTSQTAIEWVMSELIRHPRVMKLVQQEIGNVRPNREFVEESDLSKLIYLDMVVKESMRLHPVAPLLVPHESIRDILIDGYYIPNKSRILVNTWGIGRDPRIWSGNVEEFLPERFVGTNIDLRGKSFQLIPFGSGRRGCPGIHLGIVYIKLVVAQLVHNFDWELPLGISPNGLNMDESFGLTMPRANHLVAIPSLRQS